MPKPKVTAEDLVQRYAPEIARQIKKAAKSAFGNEAQFIHNLTSARVFESFAEQLGLIFQPRVDIPSLLAVRMPYIIAS